MWILKNQAALSGMITLATEKMGIN